MGVLDREISRRGVLSSVLGAAPIEVRVPAGAVRRAVILGAGPGTVLCPLSMLKPRHLWPLGEAPIVVSLLRTLRGWGIESAVLSCPRPVEPGMAASLVDAARAAGVTLELALEERPAGTAGAVRALAPFGADERVLVVVGASLGSEAGGWDADAASQWDARADAVVAVTRDGSAGERPAGLWVLGPRALAAIPATGYCSLDEQVLPELAARGGDIRRFEVDAGVSVRGARDGYHEAHQRLLSRMSEEASPAALGEFGGRAGAGVGLVSPTAVVDGGAVLVGRVALGAGARVEQGAVVEGPTSIGAGCVIGRGARVIRSVLWDGVRVGDDADVRDSTLVEGAVVPPGTVVEGAIVLSRSLYRSRRLAGAASGVMVPAGRLDGRFRGRLGGRLGGLVGRRRASARGAHATSGAGGLCCAERGGAWSRRVDAAAKRTLDVVGAAVLLVLSLPVLLAAGVAVRLDSAGPALFRQTRCGRGGRPFTMYKLRTMVANAEGLQDALRAANEVDGPMFKMERDPRVTRVGAFLRRSCIDELPQLINVLRGEMSLVGPRPLAEREMSAAGAWRDIRLRVRPGITGLWQVDGRSHLSFADWIHHDIEYVTRRTFWLDAQILVRTLVMVWGCVRRRDELGRGAVGRAGADRAAAGLAGAGRSAQASGAAGVDAASTFS